MEKVTVDDVDPEGHPAGVNDLRRFVSDALGTSDVALVHYELERGDSFSGGLHRHHDQEEVFYVLEGTATFDVRETTDAATESVSVGAGEAVRFPPGEFQFGRNDADERCVALAVAAPKSGHDWDELEWLTRCRTCEEETVHDLDLEEGTIVATCRGCGKRLSTG